MKLLSTIFLLLSTFAAAQIIPSTPSPAITPSSAITGQLQTATGGTIVNGTLNFTLSQPAVVSGTSALVTSPVSCYTSTNGNIVGVPDPLALPVVGTNTASGTLPAGTYFVRMSYVGAGGQSLPSPETSVVLSAQGTLNISAPAIQPASATGFFNVFIGTTAGGETLQATATGWTTVSQSTPLVAGAALPSSNNSACNVWFSDAISPTGTFYTVDLVNKNGSRIAGFPQTWCTFGGPGGAINVSNGAPTGNCGTNGVFYPTPIMANPQNGAAQSISGPMSFPGGITGNTTFSGNETVTGTGTFGHVVASILQNKIYASQQAGADIGAKINAAQTVAAGCPSLGSPAYQTCVVSLEDLEGAQVFTTPIVFNSHRVSLVGPGAATLTLDCQIITSPSDCIRIQDTNFNGDGGGPQQGPSYSGFTLLGHGITGVNGIHYGDMLMGEISDVSIWGFNNCTGGGCTAPKPIALWLDNRTQYTEQTYLQKVRLSNCTICWRLSNTGAQLVTSSFGYTNASNMFIQVPAGGIGLYVDGTPSGANPPLLYHSDLSFIIEELNNSVSPSVPTYMLMEAGAFLLDNTYSARMEDQNGIHPVYLNLGANYNFNGSGPLNLYGCWGAGAVLGAATGSMNVFPPITCAHATAGSEFPITSVGSGSNIWALSNFGNSKTTPDSTVGQWPNFQFTVTAGTCGSCTNPSMVITFPDSYRTWENRPQYQCKQTSGTPNMVITGEDTATTTNMTLTATGTAVGGNVYKFRCMATPQ